MKRHWMPLYVGDYLAKTSHLNALQHGAYLLLLIHYWAHEGLPNDPKQLMAIARMTPEEWSGNCHIISEFFDNKWGQKRVDQEIKKAKSISEKRSYAGLKGAFAKHGKLAPNVWQMPPQSQSHTETQNAPKRSATKVFLFVVKQTENMK